MLSSKKRTELEKELLVDILSCGKQYLLNGSTWCHGC